MSALLDIITCEDFHNDCYQFSSKELLTNSICKHLQRLLNSKQEVLQHMADYGLPDIVNFHQDSPDKSFKFLDDIKNIIQKFEPRLINVTVTLSKSIDIKSDRIINLEIHACLLDKTNISFDTMFLNSDKLTIVRMLS